MIWKKTKIKRKCYGILNMYGDFWTSKSFDSEEEALRYMVEYELENGVSLGQHKVVEAELTLVKK